MTFDRFCFFPTSSTCSFSRVKTLHATVEQRSQLHQTLGLKFKDENVIFKKKKIGCSLSTMSVCSAVHLYENKVQEECTITKKSLPYAIQF